MEYGLYDILTLDDGLNYSIADMKVQNGITYLLLIEIDKKEELTENIMLVKKENEQLEELEDPEEIVKISSLFRNSLQMLKS